MSRLRNVIVNFSLVIGISISLSLADVVLKPLHAGLALEYGQMNGLSYFEPASNAESFTINRTIGWIYQEGTIHDRLDVNLALGGMFFQFFPFNQGFGYSKVRNSAVSIGQASAKYKFGNIANPSLSISFGLMPYKYNLDSRNLGEYLFRSTPYPNTTINGSWDLINSSYANTKGILIEKDFLDSKWKNDFIISLTDEVYPLNDINLAYVSSLKLGPIELGGGFNFNNLIPSSPSLSSPNKKDNSYFTIAGVTYTGDAYYYKQVGQFFADEAKKIRSALNANAADTARALTLDLKDSSFIRTSDFVDSINKADNVGGLNRPKREYYTFKGALIMGRASLNIGALISDRVDMKVYSEVDVLGWSNYPIFYENRSERMPIMAGISLPTFGLLDYLAIEMEYWKNRYPIVNYQTLQNGLPVVNYSAMNTATKAIDLTKPYTEDDFKWSVSTKKSVGKYFSIDAQIANDHTRPIRYDFSSYKYDVLLDSKAWYYILRLQVNL